MKCIRDLEARDDIIGNILHVLHDGTDGSAMSRGENSFGIGLMFASISYTNGVSIGISRPGMTSPAISSKYFTMARMELP